MGKPGGNGCKPFRRAFERYATIKKPILCNDLWDIISTKKFTN